MTIEIILNDNAVYSVLCLSISFCFGVVLVKLLAYIANMR